MAEQSKKLQLKLDSIKKKLDKCVTEDKDNRLAGITSMKMIDGDGHWGDAERSDRVRSGRPCLTINQLPKYLNQYIGEQLQNRSRIEIRPMSNNANIQIARIREGYVRQIEYESEAEAIYDWAAKHAAAGGLGAWRIVTEETEDNPFIQTISIRVIQNALVAYLENGGMGDEPNHGFIIHRMPKDAFTDEYGDMDYADSAALITTGYSFDQSIPDKDFVTFGEYFERQHEDITVCLFDDGTILPKDKADERIKQWEARAQEKIEEAEAKLRMAAGSSDTILGGIPQPMPPVGSQAPPGAAQQAPPMGGGTAPNAGIAPPQQQGNVPQPGMAPASPPQVPQGPSPKPEIVNTKKTKKIVIKRFLFTSGTIFEAGEDGNGELFPGKYIPIVLVPGRQMNIAGKSSRSTLVKDALDSQKFLDYEVSAAAEITALQPKAPWLVTSEMIEGYEDDYKQANIKNFPYLKYKIDPASPTSHPVRQGPGEPPAAIFQLIGQADGWIKSTIGQFNADVGAEGPERSGAAIRSRQKPGDTGTYEFFVNLNKGIARTGKIINAMIPEVIDSARDLPVRAQNGTESWVPVNTTAGDALDRVLASKDRYKDMNINELYKLVATEGRGALYNSLGVGEYGVRSKSGPSYATQREEAADQMTRLLQYNPKEIPKYWDLIVENLDFYGADEFAERARMGLPQGLAKPRPGERPKPPMPPSPQVLLANATMQQKQADAQLKKMKAVTEQLKALKELAGTKPEIEKTVMETLNKLLAPEPEMTPGQGAMGQ